MNYVSTRSRSQNDKVSASQAILHGLANDGGLYMPERIPEINEDFISALIPLSYAERASRILSLFLSDYTKEELDECCLAAYGSEAFPDGAAPVKKINSRISAIELWHGPTAAFKDMALQLMPRLLSAAIKKSGTDKKALVLVATSGDTGKAALEGYRDVDGIEIDVFYPVDGVSNVQKLQMATQNGQNVNVYAIRGNFDDAQSGVKKIFSDKDAAEKLDKAGYFLSSANSINWGRLAPQIVYYFSAYCDMVQNGTVALGDKINVCVPTGNFGNIFAAYIAKTMGLPVKRLVCASNTNNVLTDFLTSGTYDRNRDFHATISPSMDILVSSNLERLLYVICGSEKTAQYMSELAESGRYTVESDTLKSIRETFAGYFADEDETSATIRTTFDNFGYLCDTHSAVGLCCAEKYLAQSGDETPMLLASTASPFKFAADVYRALTDCRPPEDYAALGELSKLTGEPIPMPLAGLDSRRVRFTEVCDPSDMLEEVFASVEQNSALH